MSAPHPFWRALHLPHRAYRDVAVTTVFLNLLAVALPVFTRVIYDRVVPNFAEATLWVLISGMALVGVFEILFKVSRAWIGDQLGARALGTMENDFIQHILHLPHGASLAKTSHYLACLQNLREFFCQKLLPTLVDTPFVFVFLLLIYLICPPMVLVPVVTGLIIIGMQYAFHTALDRGLVGNQRALEDKMQALSEILNGRETIRQLCSATPFLARWQGVSQVAANSGIAVSFWMQFTHAGIHTLMMLNSVALIAVGVYQINAGELSIGSLLAINLLCGRALAPLVAIGEMLAKWPTLRREMQAIEKVLAAPAEQDDGRDTIRLQGQLQVAGAVVQLGGYPSLRDCSLTLAAGEKLALIGASGAGKSTLLKLLSLETPLSAGRLCWDGRDSQSLSPVQLRTQIGIVEQHPYFFRGTLRDNLLLGLAREEAEIQQILEIVCLDSFIRAMGRGLELPITEGGLNLSGGQRQCLAIARALVRQPAVLLMDEPTAMMDHQMEARLVQNLRFAIRDKTLVIVTHRSPLLMLVDRIAIMEAGRITRDGQRADILKELGHAAR